MNILWDPEKNEWLKRERGVSFEMVRDQINASQLLAELPNPKRHGQLLYILKINNYVCVVPFIRDDGTIFLKTIYQNREFNSRYGDHHGKTE